MDLLVDQLTISRIDFFFFTSDNSNLNAFLFDLLYLSFAHTYVNKWIYKKFHFAMILYFFSLKAKSCILLISFNPNQ